MTEDQLPSPSQPEVQSTPPRVLNAACPLPDGKPSEMTPDWPNDDEGRAVQLALAARSAMTDPALPKRSLHNQLRRIWPAWNEFPAGMTPKQRNRELLAKKDYPLSEEKHYRAALKAATLWTTLAMHYRASAIIYEAVTAEAWSLGATGADRTSVVAIVRAVRELELTDPGLIERTEPSLADITFLQTRYQAYGRAHKQAQQTMLKLICAPLLRRFPEIRSKLPLGEQTFGASYVLRRIPTRLVIARLEALGVCSQPLFADFARTKFVGFDAAERQQFYHVCIQPRHGAYAAFLVWVIDNLPIFENPRFGWQWPDIGRAAEVKRVLFPNGLKQWASKHRFAGRVKRGLPGYSQKGIKISTPLLSEPPLFRMREDGRSPSPG